jgi:hypothetical protein
MSYVIHYTGYPRVLEGYCDANWIFDVDKIYATSGYVFSLGGGASCKQSILTRSTMEAELTALDTTGVEAEWLRVLLMDLPIVEKPILAISMNCDNQTVIIKVNSSRDSMRSTRHVKRQLKSVKKTKKLRSNYIGLCPYIKESGRSVHKGSITQCDRKCVEGVGLETHLKSFHSGNLSYVIRDP